MSLLPRRAARTKPAAPLSKRAPSFWQLNRKYLAKIWGQRRIPKELLPILKRALIIGGVLIGIYALFVGTSAYFIYKRGTDTAVTHLAERIFPYPAAVVEGDVIPLSRFRLEVAARLYYAQTHGLSTDLGQIQQAVTTQLIDRTLYAHALTQYSVVITDADVQSKLDETYTQTGGSDQLAKYLKDQYGGGIGLPEFTTWVRESLVEAAVEKQVLVNADVSHILIAVPADATADQVEAARQRALLVKGKITDISQFASVAKTYSDDIASRDNGGELGTTTRGTDGPVYSQDFEDAIFSLKIGVVSDPVRSKYGWHLILVNSRQGVIDKSLADYTTELLKENSVDTFIGGTP